MTGKKVLVIAAVLLAVVAGLAIADSMSGVSFDWSNGRTYLTNNNSWGVTVFLAYRSGGNYGSMWLDSGETESVNAEVKVVNVSRIRTNN